MKYPTIEEAQAYIPVVQDMIGKETFIQVAPEDLVLLLKTFIAQPDLISALKIIIDDEGAEIRSEDMERAKEAVAKAETATA